MRNKSYFTCKNICLHSKDTDVHSYMELYILTLSKSSYWTVLQLKLNCGGVQAVCFNSRELSSYHAANTCVQQTLSVGVIRHHNVYLVPVASVHVAVIKVWAVLKK